MRIFRNEYDADDIGHNTRHGFNVFTACNECVFKRSEEGVRATLCLRHPEAVVKSGDDGDGCGEGSPT